MEDLIQLLKDKAGLTDEQAHKSLVTIKEYIHAKVPPMFSGIVDNFLGAGFKDPGAQATPGADDFLDRANEVTRETKQKIGGIAEEAKEEVEHFAKEATERIDEWAEKADKAAKEALEKLKMMIPENK